MQARRLRRAPVRNPSARERPGVFSWLKRSPGEWTCSIQSCIYFKRSVLVSTFKPHKLLSAETFGVLVLDLLMFGNAFWSVRDRSRGGARAEARAREVPAPQ